MLLKLLDYQNGRSLSSDDIQLSLVQPTPKMDFPLIEIQSKSINIFFMSIPHNDSESSDFFKSFNESYNKLSQ